MADKLSFAETAATFGVVRNTLTTWIRRGVIAGEKNQYGFWEFSRDEVERVKALRNAAFARARETERKRAARG